MKAVAGTLLLLAASAGVCAERVYRCEDRAGAVAYRDTPCAVPRGPALPETHRTDDAVSPDVPAGALGDWHRGEPVDRQPWIREETLTIARQVQARQQRLDDQRAMQHAENRQRCAAAMRVAGSCGKFAGAFYCDAKGFQPVALEARLPPVARDNEARHAMERCAAAAARRER